MAKANNRYIHGDEEADMGIGTLILFIAMVLVAAVAATVLLSTAGSLQQQAEETGRLAEQDVASGFVVVNAMGDRSDNAQSSGTVQDNITFLQLKVRLNAGSPSVDMSNVVIEISDGSTEANLNMYTTDIDIDDASAAATNCDGSTYCVDKIRDPNGYYGDDAGNAVVSQGTLLNIFISLDSADTNMELGTQDHLSIKLIPKHGSPTYTYLTAPEVFEGRLVELE